MFAPTKEQLEGLARELGKETAARPGGKITFGDWLPGEPVPERPKRLVAVGDRVALAPDPTFALFRSARELAVPVR